MSSGQIVLKGAESVLITVGGHGVPSALYVAHCRTCRAYSDLGQDAVRPPAVWAVQHTREHPDHRHYELTTRQRWRVDRSLEPPKPPMCDASDGATVHALPPVPEAASQAGDGPPHGGRSRHALPRPVRGTRLPAPLERAWNAVARFAGPLYLTTLCGALGAIVAAAHAMGKS